MFDLFNTLLGDRAAITDEDIAKYLKNCTVKIVENGKTLVDIENGVNKLAPEKPKDRIEELSNGISVKNNTYIIRELGRANRIPEVVGLEMVTEDKSGVSNKQLITILIDRFRDNPDKVALLKQLL